MLSILLERYAKRTPQRGLFEKSARALRYGQALAAWNCGFEGARGGMYAVEREIFKIQIEALLSGRKIVVTGSADVGQAAVVACPACPPDSPRGNIGARALG